MRGFLLSAAFRKVVLAVSGAGMMVVGSGVATTMVAVATTVPKPVIIYLHAYGESPAAGLYRQDIIDSLRAHATVLTPELCGATSGATDCAVEEAHRLKLQHSPNRPVKVLALSMGAITLRNWKAAYPDDVGVAVGLIPATGTVATEATTRIAFADQSPPVPWGVSRFVCWYSPEDDVVGAPVPGSCTERHTIAGGHSALLEFPVPAIVDVLRS